jgi:hypothetical protein
MARLHAIGETMAHAAGKIVVRGAHLVLML